jgi:hypothetical protein
MVKSKLIFYIRSAWWGGFVLLLRHGIMALGSGDDETNCSHSSLENGWKTDIAALY